jgi:hypothetical protein
MSSSSNGPPLKEVGPVEIVVTPEMVQRWAGATYDEAGGYVPPAMLFGLTMMLRWKSETPSKKGDDAVQSTFDLTTFRPVRIGEKLAVTGRLIKRYVKREREYTVSEFTFNDAAGEEVARYSQEGLDTYRKVGER